MHQALYRKWRPRTFEDVVGQTHITQTLRHQVESGKLSHAYLFTGTRGTGKTTCAKILAKAVNCQNPNHGDPCNECPVCRGIDDGSILDVVEMDAASNNGVDHVRALRDEAVYSPATAKKRVYIVDEVHMMTSQAFNALLKIMEEPPEHLMFILATTELHKVPATILSRCQRFSFQRITAPDIQGRLEYVAKAEQIDLTPDGAALLARLADGAMRDGLSLLDQCAGTGQRIDRDSVLDTLGLAGNLRTAHLMNDIKHGRTAEALQELNDLYSAGKGVSTVLSELSTLCRDLMIQMTAPKGGAGLMAGGYDEQTLSALMKGLTPQRLMQMLRRLQETLGGLRTSANQRTDAELCLIALCDETLDPSPEGLSARIARLEAALTGGIPIAAPAQPVQTPPNQETAPRTAQSRPSEPQQTAPAETPPWDDLPPLPEEPAEEPSYAMPAPDPMPKQEVRTAAAPQPAAAARSTASGGGDASFWTGLLPLLKGTLKPWVYMPLTDAHSVSGRLENSTLVIFGSDAFSYKTINKPDLLRSIAQVASARAGREINVVARQGTPPPASAPSAASAPPAAPAAPATPSGGEDSFAELLRAGAELGIDID